MTAAGDLAGRVYLLAGAAAVLAAVGAGLAWGVADLGGALVGGLVMLGNFAGLHWGVTRLGGPATFRTRGRGRALWIGASGLRLGLVGSAVMVSLAGGVGARGLVLSLLGLPVAVVVAGLASARSEQAL